MMTEHEPATLEKVARLLAEILHEIAGLRESGGAGGRGPGDAHGEAGRPQAHASRNGG
jgi:hypothetical protein